MIVADTNLIAYFLIHGADTEAAKQVYDADPVWIAPPQWRSEFLNVLWLYHRAAALSEDSAIAIWHAAQVLVASEQEPDPLLVLRTAIRSGISPYDAQFVALAEILETRVVTADRPLAQRCPDRVILMSDFARGASQE